jgi:hypothetical protein
MCDLTETDKKNDLTETGTGWLQILLYNFSFVVYHLTKFPKHIIFNQHKTAYFSTPLCFILSQCRVFKQQLIRRTIWLKRWHDQTVYDLSLLWFSSIFSRILTCVAWFYYMLLANHFGMNYCYADQFHTSLTWRDLGQNCGLRGEEAAILRLRHTFDLLL